MDFCSKPLLKLEKLLNPVILSHIKQMKVGNMLVRKRNSLMRKLYALYYKVVRERATPSYIARGWAIGMFYGCIIPFGFQLILSIPSSFFLRGSKIGATLGTLLTNPVTIFFIYPAQCWLGSKIIGGSMSFSAFETAMRKLLTSETILPQGAGFMQKMEAWFSIDKYRALLDLGWEVVVSFFVGGALLAVILVPLTYFAVLHIVRRYQGNRTNRIMNKLEKLQQRQHILEVELMNELLVSSEDPKAAKK